MSIFLCARCDELRDSDDGCEEAPSKYGKFQLLCVDCLNDLEDEANQGPPDDSSDLPTNL